MSLYYFVLLILNGKYFLHTCVKPAGKGDGAPLYIKWEIVDIEAASG